MKNTTDFPNFANIRTYGEPALRVDLGGGNLPGNVYMANESRFNEQYFSEPLTTYAVGWTDTSKIQELLEFIAPTTMVPERFEFAQANNAEAFISESGTDDLRAIGADFKRVEFTSEKVSARTLNKGLTVRLETKYVQEQPGLVQNRTSWLIARLLRAEARRAFALLLAAAGGPTALTWDVTAGKNPDQDIMTLALAFADESGISPNRLLIGQGALNKRMISYGAQNNAAGYAGQAASMEQLATRMGVDEVYVSKERYTTGLETKAKIVGDYVIMFSAQSGMTQDDPSNIKRFVSPTESGGAFRVYQQQINAKLIDITVEHYSNCVVTSTLGIQAATIA